MKFGYYSFSGTVTSYGNPTDAVTVQVFKSGASEPYAQAAVNTADSSYSILLVETGSYTVKVIKRKHVTREYTVTINNDLTQDLQIFPVGDVNGNGEVDILDLVRLKCINVRNATKAEGTSADINGDGLVNAADIVSLRKLILG